jgi:hypothetical protein
MRTFDDEYDDLDEFEFDDAEATRRLTNEKRRPHRRGAGRKHHSKSHKERWESDYSDYDDYDHYYDDEFDQYYGDSFRH